MKPNLPEVHHSRKANVYFLSFLLVATGLLPESCESLQISSRPSHRSCTQSWTNTARAESLRNNDDVPLVFFYQNGERNTMNSGSNDDFFNELSALSSSLNEYDLNAEYYGRRNQEYFKTLQELQQEDSFSFREISTIKSNKKVELWKPREAQRMAEQTINSVLKSSRSSFKNVEKITFQLLNRQPLVALCIFVLSGALVAYVTGFLILDGYIDNLNPAENDPVPYWDEPEIHTIMRAHQPFH